MLTNDHKKKSTGYRAIIMRILYVLQGSYSDQFVYTNNLFSVYGEDMLMFTLKSGNNFVNYIAIK